MKTFQPIHSKNFLFVLFYGPLESWARIFKLLRTPGIDSTESIIVRNQFCYEIYSWRQRFHVKGELKVSELSLAYVVCGRRHSYWSTHFQPANNMAAVGRGWKVDSCFENYLFWDMFDSIPYLVPTQFQVTIFLQNTGFLVQTALRAAFASNC